MERATALAATCGWLAFGGGAEAAVGVAIGGAGLAAVVSDAVRRHGPESEAALKSIRERIAADLAAHAKVERWDTRADLDAADASMERALAGCFLDRKALAASARSPEGFPGSATKLILARLAEREPATFGQDGPVAARDFADLVVRTALEAAIENESYFKNLQPHLLMETLRGLGTVEEKIDSGFKQVHDTTGRTHELVKEIHANIAAATPKTEIKVAASVSPILLEIAAHSEGIVSMAYICSGEKIVTTGHDSNTSVWNTSSGIQFATTAVGFSSGSVCVAAHPNNSWFCSSHGEPSKFFSEECEPLYVGENHTFGQLEIGFTRAEKIAFSQSANLFAVVYERGSVQIFDARSRNSIYWFMPHQIRPGWSKAGYQADFAKAACFSPDDSVLATGGGDGEIKFWNVGMLDRDSFEPADCLATIDAHRDRVGDLYFSDDGQYVISSGGDGAIGIWSVESKKQTGRLVAGSKWMGDMIVAGDYVVSSGTMGWSKERRWHVGAHLIVWNWRTRRQIFRIDEDVGTGWSLAASPCARYFATGGEDGKLRIWSFEAIEAKNLIS